MRSVAIVLSLAAVICAANAQSLRSQIVKADKAVRKYMLARDAKGFASYMKGAVTSDFVYEENGQPENFDQMCSHMAEGLSQMSKLTKADSRILSLKQRGNKAEATTRHEMAGISMGPDKKPHKMSFIGTSSDSYVKQDGKWKMSKMVWGHQVMKMDGKTMKM